MNELKFTIHGTEPMLQNNPRTVDTFDEFAIAKKVITSKRAKTEEDQYELRRLEVESKIYMWEEAIYVPGRWVAAAVAANSWAQAKIKKAEVRSAVFVRDSKIPLQYDGMELVKTPGDISGNKRFIESMPLKQGQVKVFKCFPRFDDWSFSTALDYDPSIIDEASLRALLEYSAKFGGYGDFRPTYGRATIEFLD